MKKAQITDYGVVPVFGCTVKVSVTEVVTNAWLVCFPVKDLFESVDNDNVIDFIEETTNFYTVAADPIGSLYMKLLTVRQMPVKHKTSIVRDCM